MNPFDDDALFIDQLLATTGTVFDDQDEVWYQRPIHNLDCPTQGVPLDQCLSCFPTTQEESLPQQQQQITSHGKGRRAPSWAEVASGSCTYGGGTHDIGTNPASPYTRRGAHGVGLSSRDGQDPTPRFRRSSPQGPVHYTYGTVANPFQMRLSAERTQLTDGNSQTMTNLAMMTTATTEKFQQPTYAQIAGSVPILPRRPAHTSISPVQLMVTHRDRNAAATSPFWPCSSRASGFRPQFPSVAPPSAILPDYSDFHSPSGSTLALRAPRVVDGQDVAISRGGHHPIQIPRADSAPDASPSRTSRSPSVASSNRVSRRPRRTGLELRTGAHGCSHCQDRFPDRGALRRHELRAHSDPLQRPYACGCGRTFHDPKALNRHQATHNPGERLVCPHCQKTFVGNRLDNLHRHISTQHPSESSSETTDSGVLMSRQGSQMSSGSYNGCTSQQATSPSSGASTSHGRLKYSPWRIS